MYGHRARIGYCSPPFVTEVFAYEFYKMVPDGVTLMITTLEVGNEYTKEAFDGSFDRSMAAAKCMGEAGADVVVLGGNPINQSRGVENLPRICADLAREIGRPRAARPGSVHRQYLFDVPSQGLQGNGFVDDRE